MADGSVIIKIDGDDTGIKNALEGAKKGIKLAAQAATAALGAVSAYSIKVGSDFEAGMSKVEAISGASAADMERLSAKAKEMGATTKFSATESAEALQYMAMAGWKTDQMISGLPGIMDLAAASGESLASVSDIVTDALTAFGLQAEESTHFADVLAAASSNSNTNVAMMGETFKYVAPVAGSLGYSVEDTATAIGLMANAGIKGGQAGTSLRAMLTNLAKPTKTTAKYIDALHLSLTDAAGDMKPLSGLVEELRDKFSGLTEAQQAEYAAGIAGKEGMSGLLAIVNASEADYKKLTAEINNANGMAKKQAEIMNDNLKGAFTLLGSNIEGVGIQIYDCLETPLKDAVRSASDSITVLSRSLTNGTLKSSAETLGKALGTIVTTVTKFATIAIPKLISGFAFLVDHGEQVITVLLTVASAVAALKAVATFETMAMSFQTASAAVTAFVATQNTATISAQAVSGALSLQQIVVGAITGKIGLATAAQAAWNAVTAAHPFLLVGAALAALIGAIGLCIAAEEKEISATDELIAQNQNLREEYAKRKADMDAMAETRTEAIQLADEETSMVEKYVSSLRRCTDENGRVKAGYEDRAAYLTEQINNLIPEAITWNEAEGESYIKIADNIDTLIAAKKKEAYANAYQAEYEEALKNVDQAYVDLMSKQDEYTESSTALADAKKAEAKAFRDYQLDLEANGTANADLLQQYTDAAAKTRDLQAAYDSTSDTVRDLESTFQRYSDTISNMNRLDLSDTPEQINEAATAISQLSVELANHTENSVAEIQDLWKLLERARDEIIDKLQDSSMPEAERLMWEGRLQAAQQGVETLSHEYELSGQTLTDEMVLSIHAGKDAVNEACTGAARDAATGYISGLKAATGETKNAAEEIKNVCQAALQGDTTKYGQDFMRGYLEAISASDPMTEVAAMVQQALAAIPATQRSSSPSKETQEYGLNFSQGYEVGILKGMSGVISAAAKVAQAAVDKAKQTLDIHSPSHKMREQVGRMLSAGMALGVEDGIEQVNSSVALLSDGALQIAKDEAKSYKELGTVYLENLTYGIEQGRDTSIKKIEKLMDANSKTYEKKLEEQTDAQVDALKKRMEKASKTEKAALQKQVDQIKSAASEQKRAYADAAKQVTSTYTTALTEGYTNALASVKEKLSAITEEAQTQYNKIISAQDSLEEKLTGVGDVFSVDSKTGKSNFTLEKINANIDAIKRYDETLSSLKDKGLSSELLTQITAMGVEEGTKLAQSLDTMAKTQLEKTVSAWEQQQRLSAEVSSKFYADQLETLDNDFTSKLDDAMAGVPDTMANNAQASVKEWVDGLAKEFAGANSDVQEMGKQIVGSFGGDTTQATSSGAEIVDAFAQSLVDGKDQAVDAAQDMVQSVNEVLNGASLPDDKDSANTENAENDANAEKSGGFATDAYVQGILSQLAQVSQAVQEIITTFTSTVTDELTKIKDAGTSIVDTLQETVESIPEQNKISSAAGKTVKTFCTTVNDKKTDFKQVGENAMAGLESGLRAGGVSAIQAARDIAEDIISEMQSALDIHSPSRKLAALVGKPAAQGVGVGFKREMGNVYADIRQALDGETAKISADVSVKAGRQAALDSHVGTEKNVYQHQKTETTQVFELRQDDNAIARGLYPALIREHKRRGGNFTEKGWK